MSMSAVLTMGDRGRVVIPQKIREAEGLNPGDTLVLFRDEDGLTLMTRDQLKRKVRAGIKHPEKSLVDELIADRRAEALRDLEEQ